MSPLKLEVDWKVDLSLLGELSYETNSSIRMRKTNKKLEQQEN